MESKQFYPRNGPEDQVFPRFMNLPPELRARIWTLCLPYRICELDMPYDRERKKTVAWRDPDASCRMIETTLQNSRPPAISRVCFEARQIAMKYFLPRDDLVRNGHVEGEAVLRSRTHYVDYTRSGLHMWYDDLRVDDTYPHQDHPRQFAADVMPFTEVHPSLMADWFPWRVRRLRNLRPMLQFKKDHMGIEAFSTQCHWNVVIHVVVFHSHDDSVEKTGLFGLLGDAPVQHVLTSDKDRLQRYWELAKACNRDQSRYEQYGSKKPLFDDQYVNRDSKWWELTQWHFNTHFDELFLPKDVTERFRKVFQFRLCKMQCDLKKSSDTGEA